MKYLLVLLAAAILGDAPAAAPAPAHASATTPASHRMAAGFYDDTYLEAGAGAWFGRTKAAGADLIRVPLTWRAVAPGKLPPGFKASDPNAPGYDWSAVDRAVDRARSAGLRVLLTLNQAPDWAEGPHRPARLLDGVWRPSPAAFAQFATAAARRYGTRVESWQLWNEPNLDSYLAPQAVVRKGRRIVTGPDLYRGLLNAGARAIRDVIPGAVIVLGGTGPFGDTPVVHRTPPVVFMRKLLCLDTRLRRTSCPHPADFDVLAHHPYSVGGPGTHASNPGDASVPDLHRLTRLVAAAVRQRTVVPVRPKPLWVTEFSYDSKPPDPSGVAEGLRARWIGQALYSFWKQGVARVYWYRIGDQPPIPSYSTTYQSGAYLRSGAAKPSLHAFQLPFAAFRAGTGRAGYWGRASQDGVVTLQALRSGHWVTQRSIRASAFVPFTGAISSSGPITLRIAVGDLASASFSVRP